MIDHRGLSARKRDVLEYIRIFDAFNHAAVAAVLLANDHDELERTINYLKMEGEYFQKKRAEGL